MDQVNGTCANGTAFTNVNPYGFANCPSPTNPCNNSPCKCTRSTIDKTGLAVNCARLGLNDKQMTKILSYFLTPGVSPLIELRVNSNNLTQVPSLLSQFESIALVDLSASNGIAELPAASFFSFAPSITINLNSNKLTTIPKGALNFPSASNIFIDFNTNQIASIAPGAFNFPIAKNIRFDLSSNKIEKIVPGTFSEGMTTILSLNCYFASHSICFYTQFGRHLFNHRSGKKPTDTNGCRCLPITSADYAAV